MLPEDHFARAIWGLLEELDLPDFYGSIKATLGRPGQPTTDPVGPDSNLLIFFCHPGPLIRIRLPWLTFESIV